MKPYLTVNDIKAIMHVSRKNAVKMIDEAEKTQINGIAWIETKEYQLLNELYKNKRVVSSKYFVKAFPSARKEVECHLKD